MGEHKPTIFSAKKGYSDEIWFLLHLHVCLFFLPKRQHIHYVLTKGVHSHREYLAVTSQREIQFLV